MSALLDVQDLSKFYPLPGGGQLRALDGVSLRLDEGEVLGIVGESGCGKSTLGRVVLRLLEPSGGRVLFRGEDLLDLGRRALKRRRREMQIVFQDPFGSLNPRHQVRAIVGEPLVVHRLGSRRERADRVRDLLGLVGLPGDAAGRYPHEFSGGQRQRIAIARALALDPKLVVADEPVSALDVSIQSQIINLLADLRVRLKLSVLFISHDLSVIRHVSDRIAVMYLGRVVETGATEDIFVRAAHPYTQALLSAIPQPEAAGRRERIVLRGEMPDPAHAPSGCAFHTRCPRAFEPCARERPALVSRTLDGAAGASGAAGPKRETACHLYETA